MLIQTPIGTLIKDLKHSLHTFRSINYSCQKQRFTEEMERFRQYVREYTNEKVAKQFLWSEYFPEFQQAFKTYEEYYERLIETDEAMAIQAGILNNNMGRLLDFVKSIFITENYKIVQKEAEMLGVHNTEKLVMVGCGSLPETILFLAENTDIPHIIGIDNSNEAIVMAGNILEVMGHKKRVRLMCARKETFDFSGADTISIASVIRDKNVVLRQIAKTAKKGTKILVRNPFHLTHLLCTSLTEIPGNIVFKKKEKGGNCFHTFSLYEKVQ
jgi:hypothetical protein